MAQHPEKLKWRDAHPYGLSASQFGTALGFCGRVSDYINYQRNIVGTEQEFKGNAFTAHGIKTEPKSRALYELLTGCRVHDGGFFVTADRILGCSPDGQIFHDVAEPPLERRGPRSATVPTVGASSAQLPQIPTGDFGTRQSALLAAEGEPSQPQQQLHRPSSGCCSVKVPFKCSRPPRTPASGMSSHPMSKLELMVSDTTPGATRTSSDGGSTWISGDVRQNASSPTTDTGAAPAARTTSLGICNDNADSGTLSRCSDVPVPPRHHRVRLLEIKSPFRALYDCTKSAYRPFGIPTHYMCQLQGQLAIADCEECDFFVYLDHPVCQVEGWRVRRSRAFWAWAEPNLRSVSTWIKDGPPDWLNRAFAFPPFDFGSIEVIPLVYPFDVTANAALVDARRFAFFDGFSSPYAALQRRRDEARRRRGSESVRGGDWCVAYAAAAWADLAEYERIGVVAQTPAVHDLFTTPETAGADAEGHGGDAPGDDEVAGAKVQLWSRLSLWRQVLEEERVFEESATAAYWKAWTCTATAGRDPLVRVTISVPDDWEPGRVVVRCDLPALPRSHTSTDAPREDTAYIGLEQRPFFASLLRRSSIDPAEVTAAAAVCVAAPKSVPAADAFVFATPTEEAPLFLTPTPANSQAGRVQGKPPAVDVPSVVNAVLSPPSSQHRKTIRSPSCSADCSSQPRPSQPQYSQRAAAAAATTLPHARSSITPHSSQHDRGVDENQAVADPSALDMATGAPVVVGHRLAAAAAHNCTPGAVLKRGDFAAREVDAVPIFGAAAPLGQAAPTSSRPPVCEISVQDLVNLLHLAEDCDGVVIAGTSHAPQRYYAKVRCHGRPSSGGALAARAESVGDVFTLLLGSTLTLHQLLCPSSASLGLESDAGAVLRSVWDQLDGNDRGSPRAPLVPCLLHPRSVSPLSLRKTLRLLDGVPCFVIHVDEDPLSVLQSVTHIAQQWSRVGLNVV